MDCTVTWSSAPSIASFIDLAWRARLHEYLGGTVRGIGGVSESVGGIADHVHLLVSLRATHRLADVLREIKGSSSMWVHKELGMRDFGWQDGYGAFSVSPSQIPAVRKYIENQEERHRRRTLAEEDVALLRRNGVPYDEKFL